MVLVSAAFTAGVGLLQVQAALPAAAWSMVLVVPGLLLIATTRHVRSLRFLRSIVQILLAFGAGFYWAAWCGSMRLGDALPAAWEGRDIRVTGVVACLPQPFERGLRFELDVEGVAPFDAQVPKRIALVWYGTWQRDLAASERPVVRAGERWELTVRLKRPHGTANPHGFDYEAWLLERGIRATGYVRMGDTQRRLDAIVLRPAYLSERLRELVRTHIFAVLDGEPYAGVIAALVMGDQRAIPQTQWTIFTRTGVNHLMSISGLHVTMIAALLFALVLALWRRSARLCLRLPARRAATAAGLVAALAYAVIAGFAVPAQRTVYMLAVVAIALWFGRMASSASVLATALLVVVVLDPWAVLAPGFWLSFAAVASIFYVCVGLVRPSHWVRAWLQTQWAVTIGLVPLLLVMFQQISIVSPLANAFAIPVISLGVVPVALLGAALPFEFLLHAAHWLMDATMEVLVWLAALPASVWQQHAPASWTIVTAVAGIVWLLLPRGFPARWLGLIALLPLFLVVPPAPRHGDAHIAVLDVGQGLAVVVRTAKHALLYDAGPLYSPDVDSGSRIVVPYLRATGISRLDGLIVSHADNDHAGGVASVLAAVPVAWMASSLPSSSTQHQSVLRSVPCFTGQHWQWDGVDFEILHPAYETYAVERMKANDRSCVLKISAAGQRVLLTGDVEARSERAMLARNAQSLRADVLVVPHHGSSTSSTESFVAAVSPQMAIFTVGYRNRFGHPRTEVVGRYARSWVLRSDWHGAILIDIGIQGIELELQRERRRRYWHDPPSGTGLNFDEH